MASVTIHNFRANNRLYSFMHPFQAVLKVSVKFEVSH
jgi:hypothetical protein